MYIAKIPGTKYVCSLESDKGQWFLRLKLGDVTEAEVPVTQMNKRALHSNLGELFEKVNLSINSFQHDIIHKEITSQITHLLTRDAEETAEKPKNQEGKDPRIDKLLKKVDNLEETLSTLEERVNRMENLSS